ncbi:MAG: type II secretion system protein [Candidatus Omnitrophica bacterium]|nr:type II secretion system protein [Candidatus Omnitrophota bacterium]
MTSPTVKGFTIMELLVVVTIVGIIAAFAIPDYLQSVQKTREKEMIMQAKTVHGANLVYKAQNGTFFETHGAITDLATLNSALNINLAFIDSKQEWEYESDGSTYTFTVRYNDNVNGFTIKIIDDPVSVANPFCQNGEGTCPTL